MGPQAKRRKVVSAVEEVTFDPTARQEFLTGFHKRKLQRTKQAREYAEKKAHEERRLGRKKVREKRAAELQRVLDENRCYIEEANNALGSESESGSNEDEEWEGFEEPPPVDYEAEYIDEDKYTTVTVEEMDPSKEALDKAYSVSVYDERSTVDEDGADTGSAVPSSTRDKGGRNSKKPKKKRKKFRYESKAERKISKRKERLGNRKKATARRER